MAVQPLPFGLHRIDAETYHADPCARPSLSSGIARTLLSQSPLHAWTKHPRLNPDFEPVEKKTFDIGRAAHRAVLGAGGDYVAIPEDMLASNGAASTKEAKAFIQDAREAGLTPLKQDEVDQIETMADIARRITAEVGIVLNPAMSEITAVAEIDGVMCRAMFDNLPEAEVNIPNIGRRKVIIDFKTCESAQFMAARRSVESYGYDVQAQHYRETLRAATDEDRDMLFIFQEKTAPHELSFVHLMQEDGHSGDWGQTAREQIAVARALFGECLETDKWPGYPRGVFSIPARPFHSTGWEDVSSIHAATSKPSQTALDRARAWQAPEIRHAGE